VPLSERKQQLRRLIPSSSQLIRYGDHYIGDGEAFFESACHINVEGIVSKRLDSPYVSENRGFWHKTKCYCRGQFTIVGYTDPKGSRRHWDLCFSPITPMMGRLIYAGVAVEESPSANWRGCSGN